MSRNNIGGPCGAAEDKPVPQAKSTKVDVKDVPRASSVSGATQPLADASLDLGVPPAMSRRR